MNDTLKRYLVSSLVTFLSGFLFVLYTNIDNFTVEAFRDGSIIGILLVAFRAGTKGAIELFLSKQGVLK